MASRITGRTEEILFILGDPVEHIRGSAMLNDFFAEQGVDAAVSPLHVKPGDLKDALALIRKLDNIAGFGVTIPHRSPYRICWTTSVPEDDRSARSISCAASPAAGYMATMSMVLASSTG